MNTIKFRAWDWQEHKMLDFFWINAEKGGVWEQDGMDKMVEYPLERFVLMQYTNLKDKNGKEIYEGDRLADKAGHTWEVKYNAPRFYIEWSGFKEDFSPYFLNIAEVIGNIYENPDYAKK